MRLVRFQQGDVTAVGELVGDAVIPFDSGDRVRDLLDPARRTTAIGQRGEPVPLDHVRLLNPVADARLVLAVGLNYALHAAESGKELPDFPVVFNKQVGCLNGPFDPILYPPGIEMLDYEGELAFVIGRRARRVSAGEGLAHIGGYMVMNDVSTRDWQVRSPTLTLGKSFDSHGPIGPCVVTSDEIPDPGDLRLRTWVNDELRQDASTSDMIFGCGRIVEIVSEMVTLQPGDVITTGTPSGVGLGNPEWFLRVGDTVRIEIDGIGTIENTVIEDSRTDES